MTFGNFRRRNMDTVLRHLSLMIVIIVESVSSNCFIRVNGVARYNGNISVTETGKTCQRWDSSTPHVPNYQPSGDHSNYCRNPTGHSFLWCYTMDPDTRWEVCSVPECVQRSDCFIHVNGFSYYGGTVSVTETGKTCQRWDSSSPHDPNYPMSSENSNYCRDPYGLPTLWCYTMDPDTRWEACCVPECGTSTSEYITTPNCQTSSEGTTEGISTSSVGVTTESTMKQETTSSLDDNHSTFMGNRYSAIPTTEASMNLDNTCSYRCDTRSTYWLEFYYGNLTQQEKQDMLETEKRRIIRELTVNKINLSSYNRKKTSAGDKRQSSKSIGYLGVALLTTVMVLIVLVDLSNVCSFCAKKSKKQNQAVCPNGI